MKNPIHLISTRKLKSENKELLKQSGMHIGDYNFVITKTKDDIHIRETLGANTLPLVLTSQFAVRAISEIVPAGWDNMEAFTISGATTTEAKRLGLAILGTAPDATELAHVIIQSGHTSVLYPTAKIRRHELEKELIQAGAEIHILEVYEKTLMPKKVGNLDGILFLSPSQIDAFFAVNTLPEDVPAFCIGHTTARYLGSLWHEKIIIAPESSEESMIETVIDYFQ